MASTSHEVTVLGLGYVGLPLAVALAEHFPTVGYDIDSSRIASLREGRDWTGEIDSEILRKSSLAFADSPSDCPPSEVYIVTVPTPIDQDRKPDLSILMAATQTVGTLLPRAVSEGLRPIVVFESTVYPGVTEEICGPILERASGLVCGVDFFLAYSPERINPGDREHTIQRITKVISGQTPEVLDRVDSLYGTVTTGGTYRAASIKVAEAAKVIENAQRDINIAFINEVTQIFASLEISIWDVLEAAGTKWNFLPFTPGLVGGHCIGVDPYYLAQRAVELGHDPRVILAGRGVNDGMAEWVAQQVDAARKQPGGDTLVLGLTFKEDVPDLRNSKVADLVRALEKRGHNVSVHDPHANKVEAKKEYDIDLDDDALSRRYDTVLLAVPHRKYLEMTPDALRRLVSDQGILADLKGKLPFADWTI